MSFVARDKNANNSLFFKAYVTSETKKMFENIGDKIVEICDELKAKKEIIHKKVDFIMSDMSTHSCKAFRERLSPFCSVGITLFHFTKGILDKIRKCKELNKLFFKDHIVRGYLRSLMYPQFCNKDNIALVYTVIKELVLQFCPSADEVFLSLERHMCGSTKIP